MLRRKLTGALAIIAVTIGLMPTLATAQPGQGDTMENVDDYTTESQLDPNEPPTVDGVGGLTEEQVSEFQEKIRQAEASGPPQDQITPGQMWSDKVGLPDGVDKEEADRSEVAVAKERSEMQIRGLQAASDRCKSFWLTPYQVCGEILDRYEQLGGMTSWLLIPIEAQSINPDGQGYRQRFANGFIYWHPDTGAHEVTTHAALLWSHLGWEAGMVGYPTQGEITRIEELAISQPFEHGVLFLTLAGVSAIYNDAYETWKALGAEQGPLGYPLDFPQVDAATGMTIQQFTGGVTVSDGAGNATPIFGDIYYEWEIQGGAGGPLGLPLAAPEQLDGDTYRQQFEGDTVEGAYINNLAYDLMRRVFIPFTSDEEANEFFDLTYAALDLVVNVNQLDGITAQATANSRGGGRVGTLIRIATAASNLFFKRTCNLTSDRIHLRDSYDYKAIGWKPVIKCSGIGIDSISLTNSLYYLGTSGSISLQVPLSGGYRAYTETGRTLAPKDIHYSCRSWGNRTYSALTDAKIIVGPQEVYFGRLSIKQAKPTGCIGAL